MNKAIFCLFKDAILFSNQSNLILQVRVCTDVIYEYVLVFNTIS